MEESFSQSSLCQQMVSFLRCQCIEELSTIILILYNSQVQNMSQPVRVPLSTLWKIQVFDQTEADKNIKHAIVPVPEKIQELGGQAAKYELVFKVISNDIWSKEN